MAALYLESFITAYRYIRTQIENVQFLYTQDKSSLMFYADNNFLRLNLVYSFDFNYTVIIVLILNISKQQKANIHYSLGTTCVHLVFKNRAA